MSYFPETNTISAQPTPINNQVPRWNSTTSAWEAANAATGYADSIQAITTSTALTAWQQIVLANASASAITVTLPTCATNLGQQITVIKTDTSANTVTIAAPAGETLSAASTNVLSVQNAAAVYAVSTNSTANQISYAAPTALATPMGRPTANLILQPGNYDLNSSGGAFTVTLPNTEGQWVFTNANRSCTTNLVNIIGANLNYTFTSANGAQDSANVPFSCDTGGVTIIVRNIGANNIYLTTVAGAPIQAESAFARQYIATEALTRGDILELYNNAGTPAVRKAAQVVNTIGAVYNQQLSGNTANRTGSFAWMQDATTFRVFEFVLNTATSISINSWFGIYNSGTGTFNTFSSVFNNLTLSGTYNITAAGIYNGGLFDNFNGTGDLLLTIGGADGLYLFRVSRNGASFSGLLQMFVGTSINTSFAIPLSADEWMVYAYNNPNGGTLYSARISIASGAPVNQQSGSTGTTINGATLQNASYIFAATGAEYRWGFSLNGINNYSQNSITAHCVTAGQAPFAATVTSSAISYVSLFGSCIRTIYADSTQIILCILNLNSTVQNIIRFTPSGINAGAFSSWGTFSSAISAAYRQITPINSTQFLLHSQQINSTTLTTEIFNLNTATLAANITNTQSYTLPVAAEKEIICGSQQVYNSAGTGILTINSSNDPHFVVGITNAFIGTVNTNPVGLAKNNIVNNTLGTVGLTGDIITGLSDLTIGAKYYMNTTTGALQTTATSVLVGFALSTTDLQVRIAQ